MYCFLFIYIYIIPNFRNVIFFLKFQCSVLFFLYFNLNNFCFYNFWFCLCLFCYIFLFGLDSKLLKFELFFPLFSPPSLSFFLSIFSILRMKFLLKVPISLHFLVFDFAQRINLILISSEVVLVWSIVDPSDHSLK